MNFLCQQCGARGAAILVAGNDDEKDVRLCLECARERAQDDDFFAEIVARVEEMEADDADFEHDETEIGDELFESDDQTRERLDEAEVWEPIETSKSENWAARCVCGTTWEKIREEGRVGCAQCYETFRESLASVMGRVQNGPHHVGKFPRAAAKRERHQDNLRKRGAHALEMFKKRLETAVKEQNFEEAARLRDRISEAEV